MSEPAVYGIGIIGIVSYSLPAAITRDRSFARPSMHERRQFRTKTRLIRKREPTRLLAAIYGNQAFTCREIDEQTGSASENKATTGKAARKRKA
jgi:hypothetical protein